MPELPEVETVRRTLDPLLRNRSIVAIQTDWERTLSGLSADELISIVRSRTVERVDRRAKLLLLRLDSGDAISVHLRMTGELLFRLPSDPERSADRAPYLRVVFTFSDGSELLFYDIRKFGRITYHAANDLPAIDQMYGVEPLGDEFTPERLLSLLGARSRQVKPLLLDQSVIAGLGNIYVDEALFAAGIHPQRRSDTIQGEQVHLLHSAIVAILTSAIEHRGTTLRDYRSGLGEPGQNRFRLRVYGLKAGTPCPTCGSPLQRLTVGQRGTVCCPICQPLMISDDTLDQSPVPPRHHLDRAPDTLRLSDPYGADRYR
jgi:formamidopyrimidine-DNA glycosylase